jgi:hypothetical protein
MEKFNLNNLKDDEANKQYQTKISQVCNFGNFDEMKLNTAWESSIIMGW